MNVSNILRAILFAALFGAAVLGLGGVLTNLGRKAGGNLKAVV